MTNKSLEIVLVHVTYVFDLLDLKRKTKEVKRGFKHQVLETFGILHVGRGPYIYGV